MTSKGTRTKENIVEKSLHIFSVKGYYNTSVNDILEATQLTKGGLYGHFKAKDEIWQAAYERAVKIWREIVFKDIKTIKDPLQRIETALDNDLNRYLGGDVFEGGCFFLNMMVELSNQSARKGERVRKGIMGFSGVIAGWLEEAAEKGMLKPGVDIDEVSDFIVVALNGCAALYAAGHDPKIISVTLSQIRQYIDSLKRHPNVA